MFTDKFARTNIHNNFEVLFPSSLIFSTLFSSAASHSADVDFLSHPVDSVYVGAISSLFECYKAVMWVRICTIPILISIYVSEDLPSLLLLFCCWFSVGSRPRRVEQKRKKKVLWESTRSQFGSFFPASEFWALSECIKSDQKVFRVFGRVESRHSIKNRQFSCVFLTTLLWLHFLMSHLAREHGKFCENIKTEMFFNHYNIIISFFVNNFITENKWNIFFCLQFHYQRYNISCQHWMCLILAHRVRFFLVSA